MRFVAFLKKSSAKTSWRLGCGGLTDYAAKILLSGNGRPMVAPTVTKEIMKFDLSNFCLGEYLCIRYGYAASKKLLPTRRDDLRSSAYCFTAADRNTKILSRQVTSSNKNNFKGEIK